MNLLSADNTKLRKDGIFGWTIPAFRSASGEVTCPMAGKCAKGCYARQGHYQWPRAKTAHERNFQASKSEFFAESMILEIETRKPKFVRISTGGDFYSRDYFAHWVRIAGACPSTKFYAYTKCVSMVKAWGKLPPNFKIIFSFGGKEDHLIDKRKDAHSWVFKSHADLKRSGYADATESDLVAFNNRRVGLVYHGHKSKEWES